MRLAIINVKMMQPFISFLYDASPIPLQNIMVSLYGVGLYVRRYSGVYKAYLESLRESQWFTRSQLDELTLRQLSNLLEYSYANVPFYQRAFDEMGIKPKDIKDPSELNKLPIIRKDYLRQKPELFISREYRKNALIPIHTSGTTGTPLDFYFKRDAIQKNYAFFSRFLEWAGVKKNDRSATFAGRVFIPKNQPNPPFWRSNWVMNNTLFSSYNISPRSLPFYINKLEELDPAFIDSYPSAIYIIAKFILENGLKHRIRPHAIVTSSETLLEIQRTVIEEAFQCRVYDQYGNAEMVAFASQCERGSYHLNPEYGILELINSEGYPTKPGELGEMICTGFLNNAMPLIRYAIGDIGVLSGEICKCGRNFPVVRSIEGRVDDLIITRDGRRVGRLDPVFKGISSIKEVQIIQETVDTLSLNVVKGENFNSQAVDKIITELRRRLGYEMKINIKFIEKIPRTPAGKFRAVVSKVPLK